MGNCLHKSSSALISPNQPHYHTLRQTSSHSRLFFSVRRSADSQMDNIWKSTLFPAILPCMQPLVENEGQRRFLKIHAQIGVPPSGGRTTTLNTFLHPQLTTMLRLGANILRVEYRDVGQWLKERKAFNGTDSTRQHHFFFLDPFTI